MNKHTEDLFLSTLEELLHDGDSFLQKVPSEISRVSTAALSILLTIFETGLDIKCLYSANRTLSIPSLVRNLLDAYVDILLLEKDETHIYSLLYASEKDKLRALKNKIDRSDPRKVSIEYTESVRLQLKETGKAIKEFESKGKTFKHISSKYEAVGLKKVYDGVYGGLSAETHNNLYSIEARHIRMKNDGTPQLRYQVKYPVDEYVRFTLISHIPLAFQAIHQMIKSGNDPLIEKMLKASVRYINTIRPDLAIKQRID